MPHVYLFLNRGLAETTALSDSLSETRFYFPIYNEVVTGCLTRGWTLTTRQSAFSAKVLGELKSQVPDAIIFSGHDFSAELYAHLQNLALKIPVVHLSSPWLSAPFLGALADIEMAYSGMTRHLAQEGFKRIDYVRGSQTGDLFEKTRHRYISETCQALGLPTPRLLTLGEDEELPPKWMTSSDRPVAVICFNDALAAHTILLAKKAQLKTPDDLAVCGMNGFLWGAKGQRITTMVFDFAAVGRAAITLLEERLSSNRTRTKTPTILISPTFRIGDTSLKRTLGLAQRYADFIRIADKILKADFKQGDCQKKAATGCGVGLVHFQRTYRRLNGLSFSQALTQIRLDWVAKQLAKTNTTVKNLATEVGLKNAGYFYSAFSKRFGMNPKLYRNEQRK
jgi:DNA-binding LacI/PurR family transcriptional regulator/AraC-like DNA-binding protein